MPLTKLLFTFVKKINKLITFYYVYLDLKELHYFDYFRFFYDHKSYTTHLFEYKIIRCEYSANQLT